MGEQAGLKVIFSGHVQGVGFRYRSMRVSQSYAVQGYVKNLPDGTVESVIYGDSEEIKRFVRAIRVEMSDNIQNLGIIYLTPSLAMLKRSLYL